MPVQAPLWQASFCVQALESLQAEPLAAFGKEQAPVTGLQVPAVWQGVGAAQVAGLPAAQAPF